MLVGGPFYFAMVAVVFGLAWFYAGRKFGAASLPTWLAMPALYYRDALFLGIGGTAGLIALRRWIQLALWHWPSPQRELPAVFGDSFDAVLPAGSILATALLRGLLLTGALALIAAFVADRIPQAWLRLFLFVLAALSFVGGSWINGWGLVQQFVAELLVFAAIILGVRYLVRFNLLGCFLVVAGVTLIGACSALLDQPAPFYRTNGYAVIVALVALLIWPLAAWIFSRPVAPPAPDFREDARPSL
jgi:hypothetical protein